ncbi:MAG: ATP-dependent helicase [Bacteroidota bacterium]|nr:ATP-dependent helicase [Bacteroidota bacterium]
MKELFNNEMLKGDADFAEAFKNLNASQQEAVSSIHGPVMVIAGPGTGKTQILSIRIGNILLRTDTLAENILCLTYTEAGAREMRNRLQKFIGSTAYNIAIHTFHSFCNKVIQENSDYFEVYGDYELLSELESKQILEEVCSEIEAGEPMFSYKGNYIHEFYKLADFFSLIKKENWNLEDLKNDIQWELKNALTSEDFQYKRKSGENKKGDLNLNTYNTFKRKFDRTTQAINLFEKYQEKLKQRKRYDYDDMIQWVLTAFQNEESILAQYQEKYQFILVDEYQDTNGSQNAILYSLLSYWDDPNIFVVGDDDQAIFRFQGANVNNMLEFLQKYEPKTIVLEENYRSSPGILKASEMVISDNKERLIHALPNLRKNLIAMGNHRDILSIPSIRVCRTQDEEASFVIGRITKLIQQNVPLHEIAILYKNNQESEIFSAAFRERNIDYSVSKEINILQEELVKHLLKILEYFEQETHQPFSGDVLLYQILHFPYFNISSLDIGIIAWNINEKRKYNYTNSIEDSLDVKLQYVIGNEILLTKMGIKDPLDCLMLFTQLDKLKKDYYSCTIQNFLDKIINTLPILKYILSNENKIYLLQVLNSFFEYIKNESTKKTDLSVSDIFHNLHQMNLFSVKIPIQLVLGSKAGIQLSTVHGSKGLEYEYVFIINATANHWTSKDKNKFIIPSKFSNSTIGNLEDQRRLFFVAMTRAKKELQFSYSINTTKKKEESVTPFLVDAQQADLVTSTNSSLNVEAVIQVLINKFTWGKKKFEILEDSYFQAFLENYQMSPTALDAYLKCPVRFYYEKVLRIPSARSANMGYGKAVHFALEYYFKNPENRTLFNETALGHYFTKGMNQYKSHFTESEFDSYTFEGNESLPAFIKNYLPDWKLPKQMEFEKKIDKVLYQSVPIKGNLDRLDHFENWYRIIDYKTGSTNNLKDKYDSPTEKNPYGTDYWRQLVFYSILLKINPSYSYKKIIAELYFIKTQPNGKFAMKTLEPNVVDQELVGNLIIDTYKKITNKVFTPGCGEKDCVWCSYLDSGQLKNYAEIEEEDVEDEDQDYKLD